MAGLLRLMTPTYPPHPLFGNRTVAGGCVALPLVVVRDRMIGRRDHLAERSSRPPDPLPADAHWMKKSSHQGEMNRHQEYLRLVAAVAEVEAVIEGGADLELKAVLTMRGRTEVEASSAVPILQRQFEWAECRGCDGRRCGPNECEESDWSQVADPLAGIGGKWLCCPSGHVIFAKQTWTA